MKRIISTSVLFVLGWAALAPLTSVSAKSGQDARTSRVTLKSIVVTPTTLVADDGQESHGGKTKG